uniref:Uncharacterized protein n=1 Tax=Setaria digitata TaxID=48799 RepID=A0A915PRN9_9BILA
MDLDVALQKASEDEGENQYDEVYPGRVLKGEDTPGSAKIRYIRGCREPKTFARYTSSLKNMIPLRPFHKYDRSRASKVDESGLFSFITFSWIFPYLWAAFRGRLNQNQVWNCSIYDASSVNLARLEYLWKQELLQRPNTPSLFRVVCLFVKTRIFVACFIFIFCLVFGFIGPMYFVKGLISFAEQPPLYHIYPSLGFGIFLAFAILIVEVARVLSYGATWAVSYRTGIRVRGALLALLYKKLINVRSLRTKTGAEVVNIFANDGQRLLDAVSFAPLVLVGPLVLIGGIFYLLTVIGPWSLLGILTFLVFDAIQFALGKTLVSFRTSAIEKTEKRVKFCFERLRLNISKTPGLFASFILNQTEMRHNEKVDLRKAGLAQSLTIAFGSVVPVVAAVFTFLGLILSGGNLLAADAFSTITVFFIMMFAIRMIPYGSRYCAEAFAALKRIQELLLYPEYDQQIPFCQDANIAIQFKNATFLWDEKSQASEITSSLGETSERSPVVANEQSNVDSSVALKGITLAVRKKELLGICGPVGSGKTALLSAIVGHLVPNDGSLNVSGPTALITQTPWILNRTVQSNILFGLPMNTSRYYKAITVCELTKDLETMKAGDQTEIGERGVTISGGQKARIALARALFANCRIYLLDDIFASLDQEVADRIFKRAVKEMLANKTVLMVTTDVQRLSKCDRVCYMEDGKIKAVGTHDELLEQCEAYALYCEHSVYSGEIKSISETTEERNFGDDFVKIESLDMDLEFVKAGTKVSDELRSSKSMADLAKPSADGQLIMDEENLGFSTVSWEVYKQYIAAVNGRLIWIVLLLAFIGNVIASIFSTAWLSQWLKYGHSQQIVNVTGEMRIELNNIAKSEYTSYYASIYGFSVVILFISGLLKALIFVHVSLDAASRLHNRMFNSVIRGTVHFFDTTPSGRILNRFSKDMDEIDVKLPFTAEVFLQNSLTCIGYLIMIAWVFPSFLLPCIFLFCIFAVFVLCFRAGITSLKRSENISRSPLFDHISASMEGIHTIHSLGQTDDFIDTLKNQLDLNR